MKQFSGALTLLGFILPALAADYTPPTPSSNATSGDAALTAYFETEVASVSSHCLADVNTLDDWKAHRAELRRQLQEMLGLSPMPERTDLNATVSGKLEQNEFTVEKISFQASPQLYCTANLYIPKNLTKPAPTILYECGHARSITNGISLGNKAVYQTDGAWYARNGYVCLVLDTMLAGEIQGVHTGTRDRGLWWWNSRGYTPAGVEAWFGIRALDYLCTRPEVDTNRFGVTGHSGGGAYSWTVTALDDRIKAAAPLAGMADLRGHILDNLMDSHCDCNFSMNIYRWDFPQLAALAAPRPLLIGGTDSDRLFPLESTTRIHEKVRRIYKLYKAENKLGLVLAPGPHDEVPELQLAVMRWFNRHLKGEESPVETTPKKFFAPVQLRVFETLPADAINTNIAETFVAKAEGEKQKAETGDALRAELREKAFSGWPSEDLPLEPKQILSVSREGLRLTAWDFTSQHDVSLRIYLVEDTAAKSAGKVQLRVLDEKSGPVWLHDLRAGFGVELADEPAKTDGIANIVSPLVSLKAQMKSSGAALAWFAPRGVGLTAWSGDEKRLTKIRRRFMLLGQTLDGMRVWDMRRAIQTIHFVREGDLAQVELQASGTMAANALYAALFEPGVKKLSLTSLPASHNEGPDYLGVLKFTDIADVRKLAGQHAELNLTDVSK
ncbi:MAG: acetylxylan esterase [Verrucomicrobia bacterium]|nr:MAG: acetylxylan esterase [Verrucomicrobiota bacterium]